MAVSTDVMDGFGGPQRKEETERGTAITVVPVHLFRLSQSGQNAVKWKGGVGRREQVIAASVLEVVIV